MSSADYRRQESPGKFGQRNSARAVASVATPALIAMLIAASRTTEVFVRPPNALVQLQAHYHHRGEVASEKCLSAATFVRQKRELADPKCYENQQNDRASTKSE